MRYKKIIVSMIIFASIASTMVACGNNEESSNSSNNATIESSVDDTAEKIPDGEFSVSGEGQVYLSTAGGTTEDGTIPVIYCAPDTIIKQIGINSSGYDGSMLTYIYIDGMLNAKEQLADTQSSIDLQGDSLSVGIHTVEVVQYTGDFPSADAVSTYQTMQYEIKSE